ncbi:MAG: nucleoside phosphorylase [Bacteroidales bacterium]|nr:nucleoside phosphorylase [Bacteroidales bacterium]
MNEIDKIASSELVLAPDGSLYHIRLTGDTLADDVFLVGDPGRVNMFKNIFDKVEHETQYRELHSVTGKYHGHRMTALSTGMGCDNIDIVLSELDAAANIDLKSRRIKKHRRALRLVRIGTCGSLQREVACGSRIVSACAIGLDGLLNYYEHEPSLMEESMQDALQRHLNLPSNMATPYCVAASNSLLNATGFDMTRGITATAPGFYAPQGRQLRIAPALHDLNEKLASFQWNGMKVVNLEMETSAIYGLGKIMGHETLTACLVIANRADGTFLNEYEKPMRDLVATAMDRMSNVERQP